MEPRMITRSLALVAAGALVFGARLANAVLISPSADGNVWKHSLGAFSIETNGVNVSANFNPIEELRGILEFPLNSIPAGSLVSSATLRLYVDATGGDL